jgi:cysteine desulfurase
MAKRGCEVTFVGVDRDGNLDIAEVGNAIRPETAIVSIMWANNETGVLFPVEKIAEICREKRVFFHTDAVQAFGKIPLQLGNSAINFLSLAAHKFHGPKGVGVLYVSERSRFKSSILGGSHEDGRRAGTENVASIVGMGKAAERATECLTEEQKKAGAMRDEFEAAILRNIPEVKINGAGAARLCNTANISFAGVESQAALMMLDRAGICCSAGSACKTGSQESSHVLRAMKVAGDYLRGTIRFSFGRFNSKTDLTQSIEIVPRVVAKLRALSAPAPVRVSAL